MVKAGCTGLEAIFTMTQSVMGYGQLSEVPAFYGLLWNSPLVGLL